MPNIECRTSNIGRPPMTSATRVLYHFCRLQVPLVALPKTAFDRHLRRCFELFRGKRARAGSSADCDEYLENLYAVDWFLCCGCLEGDARAWECLFAARASRADCLLVDALRAGRSGSFRATPNARTMP